jgi:alpha-galactosidase
MPAAWDAATNEIHLHNGRISYLARVLEDGSFGHLYFGPSLTPGRSYRHLGRRPFHGFANRLGEPVAREYPTGGSGDFRVPALIVVPADGSTTLHLAYAGHRILPGKPALPGLPATYVERDDEAETVEVLLVDAPSGLEVRLRYTIFAGLPAIARSATIRNGGTAALSVRCAMSGSLDLPDADWDLLQLSGTWSRERHVVTRRLAVGRQSVSSQRGASSHEHNPFVVLKRADTTEDHGEAYGFSLVYSGNFRAEADVDAFATTRVRIGIEPDGFAWNLEPGEELATPEVVMVCAADGLGELSATYHHLYGRRLARGAWRDRRRPVLLNSWEGTYFDFTEDSLVEMAAAARDLGIELFVLDDGWFGERDDATSSLGDWTVDRRKLPGGLEAVARRILDLGMQFGLWIEPEMVNPRSRLFARHPEWAVGVPSRPPTESRDQLVLDLSRPEVVDHLFTVLSEILGSAPISYVKWDMNRSLTEPYSAALPPDRQGEFFHRHILGVYELHERLTRAFPEILFESCAAGGGRFDPGLLAYAPQGWTSDDTDAVERLAIQWGTSLAYPLSSMAAHVSAVPNHQVGRVTPLATRAAVAFFGVFGYELDPRTLTAAERIEIGDQVAFYKEHRDVLQRGRFHRLRSPFEGDRNTTAWMTVAEDARHAVVGWYRVLNRAEPGPERMRLRGLDPAARYRVHVWPATGDRIEQINALVRGGDDLMQVGLFFDAERHKAAPLGDFYARIFVLEAVAD